MTVSTTLTEATSLANGVSVSFPVPFQYALPSDLIVELIDVTTNDVALLVEGADYVRVGDGMAAPSSITTIVAAPAGKAVRRRRRTTLSQQLDMVPNVGAPAEAQERAHDRAIMGLQEREADHIDLRSRALQLPAGEASILLPVAADRAGSALVFDGAGQPVARKIGSFPAGPSGPANSTYTATTALVAAPITNRSYTLADEDGRNDFSFVALDFTGQADGVDIFQQEGTPLSSGALVRKQGSTIRSAAKAPALPIPLGTDRLTAADTGAVYVADEAFDLATYPQAGFVTKNGRKFRLRRDQPISLRWFGAKGDGITVDDAAITAWIKFGLSITAGAANAGGCRLYVPAGLYMVSSSGLFSPDFATPNSKRFGISFDGDGPYSSVFRFIPDLTSETWMHDNVPDRGFAAATFRGLGFQGCPPSGSPDTAQTNANFFRCTSMEIKDSSGNVTRAAWEQNYVFDNIVVSGMNNVEQWSGNNLASEVRRINCHYEYNKGVLHDNNNPQSLNHAYMACSIIHYGPSFLFRNAGNGNGGGSVYGFGNNVILLERSASDGDVYFWDVQAGGNPGATPSFFGADRFEMRGLQHKLFRNAPGQQGDLIVDAHQLQVQGPTGSISTGWAVINRGSSLTLRNTEIYEYGAIPRVELPYTGFGENQGGLFEMEACTCSKAFVDNIFVARNARAIGRNLRPARREGNSPFPAFALEVLDFAAGTPTPGNPVRYPNDIELFTPQNRGWPGSAPFALTDEEITCSIRVGELIREIHFERRATGGDTTLVRYFIGSNDKSVVYAQTAEQAANLAVSLHLRDLSIDLDSTNRANLRVWASASTTARFEGGSIRLVTKG